MCLRASGPRSAINGFFRTASTRHLTTPDEVISWSSQRGNFPAFNLLGTSSCWQSEIGMSLCAQYVDICWYREMDRTGGDFSAQIWKIVWDVWDSFFFLRRRSIYRFYPFLQDPGPTSDIWAGGCSSDLAAKGTCMKGKAAWLCADQTHRKFMEILTWASVWYCVISCHEA